MADRDELEALRKLKAARDSGNQRAELDALRAVKSIRQPEATFGEKVVGGLETAGTLASSIIAEPVAGAAGLLSSPLGFVDGMEGVGADVVADVRESLTFQPKTKEGVENIQAIGEFVEPAIEVFEGVEKTLGEKTLEVTGSPELAAIAHTLPTAALEALGIAGIKAAPKAAGATAQATKKAVDTIPQRQPFTTKGKAKQRIGQLIEEGSADIETAKFSLPSDTGEKGVFGKLNEKLISGKAFVEKDPIATESIKQGFDEGVIAAVKASNPEDRAKMLKMVDVMERGKKNKRVAVTERPTDIVGDSLMQRVRTIRSANRSAGKELESVAQSLKGEKVDFSPAVNSFIDELGEMGISIGDDLKPNFIGSDIEGVTAAENAINNVVRRMIGSGTPDAHDVHRMKKFIDEHVTFGKSAEGLAGQSERVLKGLRRSLDDVLDNEFPEYNRVNTQYAETVGALDALQDVAGRKMDLTGANADKAVGQLMRRVMSNAQSRVRLVDAIDQVEGVANKYISKGQESIDGKMLLPDLNAKSKKGFTDDLLSQVLFADELDSVFKPVARTSFQGQIEQAVNRGATAAQTGGGNLIVEGLGKAGEKLRGINEENAFKSIKELLKEQR